MLFLLNQVHTSLWLACTVSHKIFTGENIGKFDEFPAIRQYFPIKIFHLVSYLPLMNLWQSGSTRNKII